MALAYQQGMTDSLQHYRENPSFSLPSILALVCAIGGFFVGALLQIVLAVAAIALGALGIVISISPAKRGGIMSVISIIVGVLAIIIAVLRGVFGLVF